MMSQNQSEKYNVYEVYRSCYCSLMLDKRDGGEVHPVSVRVTYKAKRRYYRTGAKLSDEDFQRMLRANKGPFHTLREEQKKYFAKVVSFVKKLSDHDMFTLERLSEMMGNSTPTGIEDLFLEKIETLTANNQIGTAVSYRYTLNKIKKFAKGKIDFSDVTPAFLNRLKKQMEDDGLTSTSIGIYFRNIRAICNMAIARGYMKQSQYPFAAKAYDVDKIKIQKGAKRKDRFLKVGDILKLMTYDTDEHKASFQGKIVCESLNMWLFSYLANGMNLADMAFLTYNSHYFRTKGKEFSFVRRKTERTTDEEIVIYVPIIEPLKRILDEYGAKPSRNALVFPQLTKGELTDEIKIRLVLNQENKNIRKRLERVCDELELEHISMTWARHSYQTNLAHKRVPNSYIDQAVGHADGTVTDGYIGMYSMKDRFKYNSLLLEPDKNAGEIG